MGETKPFRSSSTRPGTRTSRSVCAVWTCAVADTVVWVLVVRELKPLPSISPEISTCRCRPWLSSPRSCRPCAPAPPPRTAPCCPSPCRPSPRSGLCASRRHPRRRAGDESTRRPRASSPAIAPYGAPAGVGAHQERLDTGGFRQIWRLVDSRLESVIPQVQWRSQSTCVKLYIYL